jgi:hypothetical protein
VGWLMKYGSQRLEAKAEKPNSPHADNCYPLSLFTPLFSDVVLRKCLKIEGYEHCEVSHRQHPKPHAHWFRRWLSGFQRLELNHPFFAPFYLESASKIAPKKRRAHQMFLPAPRLRGLSSPLRIKHTHDFVSLVRNIHILIMPRDKSLKLN